MSEKSDGHRYRLEQAVELLRALGYREVQTPDGRKWEKAKTKAEVKKLATRGARRVHAAKVRP